MKFAIGPEDYYVDLLRECVEGVGTSERRLLYTVVKRAEVNKMTIRLEVGTTDVRRAEARQLVSNKMTDLTS